MIKSNKDIAVSIDKSVENYSYYASIDTFRPDQSMNGILHYHHHYEILYVTEGERIIYLNNNEYILDSSCIALLSPYIFHGSVGGYSPKQTRFIVSFKDCFLPYKGKLYDKNLLSCFTLKHPVIKLNAEQQSEVYLLLEKMMNLYQNRKDFYCKTSFAFYLCNLLLICMKNISDNPNLTSDAANITGIIDYIEKYYYEDINLDNLSQKFFLNKYKLSRLFKNSIGLNMLKYVNKIRIAKSKEMLVETDQKITHIAGNIGFNNTTHFNRVFKIETGCSPSEYRDRHRSCNENSR